MLPDPLEVCTRSADRTFFVKIVLRKQDARWVSQLSPADVCRDA
jgi:hypothetical protein